MNLCKYLFGILLFAINIQATEFPVCTSSGNQLLPDVASCGTNYLVVWSDETNFPSTGSDIWGRIILENETMKAGFSICNATGNQNSVKIEFDGDNYLVIWVSDNKGLYGQFVDTSGTLIDTNFLIANGAIDIPALATNNNNYLIAWTDSIFNINACIISKTGAQITAPFAVCSAADTQIQPTAAPITSGYIIAWADRRAGNFDIYGQRISPTGSLINNNFSISPTSVLQKRPQFASSGIRSMVTWEEDHGMLLGFDIHGSILDTSMGYLYNDFAVCDAQWDQRGPSICWDYKMNEFLVGWHDYRVPIINKANIYMARVDQTATPAEIQVTNNDNFEHRETNIARSINCYIIVWEDWRQGTSNKNIYAYIPAHMAVDESADVVGTDCNLSVYPNPCSNYVKFTGKTGNIKIYDNQGRVIRILGEGQSWNGRDQHSNKVPAGIYFAQPSSQPSSFHKLIKL